MYACTLWEWVYEFIDGERCEEGGKVQWNIAKNMVGEFKIKQTQIDSYMTHTYYECAYGRKDYKNHPQHEKV
jgi:hypothetical protein